MASAPALVRLAVRILVVVAFAILWRTSDRAAATAILCAALAVGCALAAFIRREPVRLLPLNHWAEAAILLFLASLIGTLWRVGVILR